MKTRWFLVYAFMATGLTSGQVVFTEMPVNRQLVARQIPGDTGRVHIRGTVGTTGSTYTEIRLKVFRNAASPTVYNAPLSFGGGVAQFAFHCPIKSELANYRFEVYGVEGAQENLLRIADSVVCGDAYIVTGQSNAEAGKYDNSSAAANNSPWIRVFGSGNPDGSDSTWYIGQGDGFNRSAGNTGQWGLRLARLIVDNQQIPVAVFNGAHGGMPIQFFQKNMASPFSVSSNYGRMLIRTGVSGLAQHVRAILWHQGENNADGTSAETYMDYFRTLRASWQGDFPAVQKFYVFQIRNGCNHTLPDLGSIKEAQRRLALEIPDVEIMSTSGQDHAGDGCHYAFVNGYETFGTNIYRLVARDLYGAVSDTGNLRPPSVKYAEISGQAQVTLIMRSVLDDITFVTGSEPYFTLEGSAATVNSAVTSGNRLILNLSAAPSGLSAISYLGHEGGADPLLRNSRGIGALHFYRLPITPARMRDSLAVLALLQHNKLALSISEVTTRSPGGRIRTLNLAGRGIHRLTADLADLDSLDMADLRNNALTDIPRELTVLNPSGGIQVDGNRLCSLDAPVLDWVNRHATNADWRSTQNCAAPVINGLRILPDTLLCSPGQRDTITVQAIDQFGAVMGSSPEVELHVSGGTITSRGHFTAPDGNGRYFMYASSGPVQDTAVIFISSSLTKLNPGPVTRLLVLEQQGSPYIRRDAGTSITTDFTGRDATLRPRIDGTEQIGGLDCVWKEASRPDGIWMGTAAQDSFISYSALYLFSPQERQVFLAYSHDDDLLVRLSDQVIVQRGGWTVSPRQPEILAPCQLKKGVNTFVFKLIEGYGGNYFTIRFTDHTGSDLDDLYAQLTPDSSVLDQQTGARGMLIPSTDIAAAAIQLKAGNRIGVTLAHSGTHLISVFSLTGRQLAAAPVTGPGTCYLPVKHAAHGLHIVRVTMPDGQTVVKRLVGLRAP